MTGAEESTSASLREAAGDIRKPRVTDIPGVKVLVDNAAAAGEVLPRTVTELFETIRDLHVFIDEEGVGGCCTLHVDLADLAEVRSLVVREDLRGRGLGRHLVRACLDEARELGIARVYALTRVPAFFRGLGFQDMDKHDLPSKVFRDCVRCPEFPDCDEVAVVYHIDENSSVADAATKER
jgi:amino-acid N-acetyltransferase